MAKKDLRPAALAAGIVVVGGVILYSMRKKKFCTELPDIWTEEGPLHLTADAQEEAFELARGKLLEYMISSSDYKLSDIYMYVADSLRDCAWEDPESKQQKEALGGIKTIVNQVNAEAKQDPDEFRKRYGK